MFGWFKGDISEPVITLLAMLEKVEDWKYVDEGGNHHTLTHKHLFCTLQFYTGRYPMLFSLPWATDYEKALIGKAACKYGELVKEQQNQVLREAFSKRIGVT